MQITLIVPELIWPEPDADVPAGLNCPALCTLLSRSRRTVRPPQSYEATLADAFGQPPDAPYAAFRLLGEARAATEAGAARTAIEPGQHDWLCCDPVHLRYHQQQLILADAGHVGISQPEAQALVAELNRQLADVGRFHVASAGRWYLRLADRDLASGVWTPPLSAVAGRRIEHLLPETASARALRVLLNETQMLLHAHPINAQREDAGLMPINSLWLWGAGALPARRESDVDGVWSGDPLALGLARAAGVPAHPLPLDAATLFEHGAADSHHLIVLDALLGPIQYELADAYRTALDTLERRWFAPLAALLKSGKVTRLRLEASTAYAALAWESTRRDQWKLWRRAQPLAALAKSLAAPP